MNSTLLNFWKDLKSNSLHKKVTDLKRIQKGNQQLFRWDKFLPFLNLENSKLQENLKNLKFKFEFPKKKRKKLLFKETHKLLFQKLNSLKFENNEN